MPTVSSDASFRVLAKHLFRHMHEPRALRRNALVRRFFEDARVGAGGRLREQAALERIHALVRRGAEHCREADLKAGKNERALRQYAIVTSQCLDRQPIAEVAVSLSISRRQCYRERADISQRVAEYIREHNDEGALAYLKELDEFRFLMDRAMRRAAVGDARAAFEEYDELVRAAPTVARKIEALRTSALTSIDFGNIERAEEAYTAAVSLFNECSAAIAWPLGNVSQACIDLIASKLAYYQANTAQALLLAQHATERLESAQANAPGYVQNIRGEHLRARNGALQFWRFRSRV